MCSSPYLLVANRREPGAGYKVVDTASGANFILSPEPFNRRVDVSKVDGSDTGGKRHLYIFVQFNYSDLPDHIIGTDIEQL